MIRATRSASSTPARLRDRICQTGRLFILAGLACLCAGKVYATDLIVIWAPAHQTPAERMRYDLELGLQARRLLIDDPMLISLDIDVHVENRVAILRGSVASSELSKKAESSLHKLVGLASVRNDLRIEQGPTTVAADPTTATSLAWRPALLVAATPNQLQDDNAFAIRPGPEPSFVFPLQTTAKADSRILQRLPLLPEGASASARVSALDNGASGREWSSLRVMNEGAGRSTKTAPSEDDILNLPALDLPRPLGMTERYLRSTPTQP